MDHVSHLVTTYGYVLVFMVVFLDQAAISIPSPPFVTAMGVLASSGRFNIWSAFVVVLVAALVADCLWSRIGLSTSGSIGRCAPGSATNIYRRSPILSDEASSVRYSPLSFRYYPAHWSRLRQVQRDSPRNSFCIWSR